MDESKSSAVRDTEHPEARAGDPFHAASLGYRRVNQADQDVEDRPHGCIGGYHYVGHLVEGEDGEEVEVFEGVPCRWCSSAQ